MFLKNYTVSDLLPVKPKKEELTSLISITHNTSLEECLALLVKYNILSVPVYNTDEKKYVGVVDMYEIMSFVAFASWDATSGDVSLQQFVAKTDMSQPASNLLGTSGVEQSDNVNSLWIQSSSAGIKETLELMGKGVYRLLVQVAEEEFKILTQSDLIRFLSSYWEEFSFKDMTVGEAFEEKRIHKITTSHTALKGFQIMRLQQVNALAITDEHGKLIGTISGSDLRGLSHDKVANVLLPVMDFLKSQHGGVLKPPITCKKTDKVKAVTDKLITEKVHRVWITNDAEPIGVVSLSDLALFVFTQTISVWYPADETI